MMTIHNPKYRCQVKIWLMRFIRGLPQNVTELGISLFMPIRNSIMGLFAAVVGCDAVVPVRGE